MYKYLYPFGCCDCCDCCQCGNPVPPPQPPSPPPPRPPMPPQQPCIWSNPCICVLTGVLLAQLIRW